MRLEKLRHIIILKALLETDVPLTASSLASLSRSSLRTVKDDIAYLNSLCVKENILEIRSLKAKGYLIAVKDSDRYMDLRDDVEVLHSLFYGKSVEGVNRRMYILQRFLSDDHVKIEDLSEKLYISRSSIRKDVAWTRRFLNSYHIDLLSDADGYRIKGREQDLRSAMVELRCSQCITNSSPCIPMKNSTGCLKRTASITTANSEEPFSTSCAPAVSSSPISRPRRSQATCA